MWSMVHTEWSDGYGGQEHRILLECREMLRRGHRVRIACRPEGQLHPKAREAGIPVTAVPIRSSADLRSIAGLVSLFRKERVDVVNTHSGKDSWVASIAAKIAGVPLLVRTRHISIPIRRHAFNLIYRWPDGYVTTGEKIREHLIEKGISPDRVESIPTGVDVERFAPGVSGDGVRAETGVAPGDPVVSIIGILRRTKRVEHFVELAASLHSSDPRIRFWIVGEGPQEGNVRESIRKAGMEGIVSMLGHRDDIPEVLAATDVVVMTSEAEGLPQVILQAMAAERAVVSTPVGAIPEVLRHGETGLFCPVGDVPAFAREVRRLLDDPLLRKRLGRAGRDTVLARHTVAAMCDRTEAFYSRLAASG